MQPDKTEVAITINICMMGKLELFDCKTGDLELIETLGRIPDEQWVFRDGVTTEMVAKRMNIPDYDSGLH